MNWPQHFGWLLGPLGWLLGPFLGLGVWWAEGRSSGRKPDLATGSADDAVWENNFWLNRLLLAVLLGTFGTVLVVVLHLGWRSTLLDTAGAFGCGCLAWAVAFLAISRPHVTSRYRDLQRFGQLRYGYGASSVFLIVPACLFALCWIVYVVLRV